MIKSFRHKGLEDFYNDGSKRGIQPKHAKNLKFILDRLEMAQFVQDMNFEGSRLHPLKGELEGFWSVRVSGNWRVLFKIENGNAYMIDYLDYH